MEHVSGHILVVEDNATTARTLRVFLEAHGHRVTTSTSGADAIARMRADTVDLILLDRMLPDIDGIDLCRRLRATDQVPIVLLTARTSEDDIVDGLEAGADDYVCKPFGAKTLVARVHRCLRRVREPVVVDTVIRHATLELDAPRRAVRVDGQAVRLTRSEFDILHCLMRSPGRVFTRAQIIAAALDPDFDGFDRTVDTHIWSLRRKLTDRRGGRRLIVSEPGVGYRLAEDDEIESP